MRTVLRIAAAGAWLLGVAPVAATFGADTSAPPEQGWWNKQQALPVQGDPTGLGLTTVPTVPAPATVPEDGLYVASDGSGPSAISAVRYQAGGGGTLTLKLAEGTTLTGTEKLVACPVQGGFTPVQNGQWTARPAYDETACVVEGTPAEDGSSFSFQIPSTFASALGDLSVVLAPAAGATPFTLPFQKPTTDSFVVTTPVAPQPTASDMPAYEPGSAVYSSPVAPSAPSYSAPSTPSAGTPTATAGSGQAGATPPVAAQPAAALHDASRTDQLVAVLVLALIGGAFWVLSNQQQRAPRLLGSVGGSADPVEAATAAQVRVSRPRGVGRFVRHRAAPPTTI